MNGTSVASSCIAGCCLSEEETELGHTTNILVRSQLCWIYEVWSIRIINNQQMWIYSGQQHQIGWCCTQTMYYSWPNYTPSPHTVHPSIHPTIHPPNIIQAKGNSSNLFAINRETQEEEAASVGGGWIVGVAVSVQDIMQNRSTYHLSILVQLKSQSNE